MASWIAVGYSLEVRAIVAAYRTSCEAFRKEMHSVEKEWEQYKSSAQISENKDTCYLDYLSDQAFDAEYGLRLIREAFAITLYHFWEKQMNSLFDLRDKKDHDAVIKHITKDGRMSIDTAGLNRLRLIANTVKHGKGFPLYKVHPTLFAPEARELPADKNPSWHLFLRLDDADIEMAISAIEASGPGSGWDDGSIEEI